MRKIDKTLLLSSDYKNWEESMGEKHSPYNSSKNKYYYDVVMNLLHCQKGVCAYTEISLCDEDYYQTGCWIDGKYSLGKPEFSGALDHFDPTLKKEKGWLWGNLFMVQKDINDKHKRDKVVDYILKPDTDAYNPSALLEYDELSHIFIANTDLDELFQERINNMLELLGINLSWVRKNRKVHLQKIIQIIESGGDWGQEATRNHQFFTAFAMCREKLQTQEN